MKWKTSPSSTLYGSAYFLSIRTRMKSEVGPGGTFAVRKASRRKLRHLPVYSMLASRISAADEWSTGTDTFVRTDATMAASFNVHPF